MGLLLPEQAESKHRTSYHPEHVPAEADDEDPLSHPTLDVNLWPEAQRESVPSEDSELLLREYQITGTNALQWAGVVLVADSDSVLDDPDHQVGWSVEDGQINANPIPDLTERVGARAETQLVDPGITETELEAIEVLVDGGPRHHQHLAQKAQASSSIMYRLAQELGIVETDNGSVRFPNEVTHERIKTASIATAGCGRASGSASAM